jgi:hypothetical protein
MNKIAESLKAFRIAINSHDRENPTHPPAYGIEVAPFDLDRLGFEEGEELWSGCTIHSKEGRQTGTFRTLCDFEEPRKVEVVTGRLLPVEETIGA